MTDDTEILVTNIGHNLPPSDHERAIDEQVELLAGYEKRRDEFILAAERAVIRDRATVGDAGDVIHLANRVWSDIDEATKKLRAPFRATADRLKARVDDFWQPLIDAHQALQAKIDAWMVDEDKRIAEQRAEQDAILGGAPAIPGTAPSVAATAPRVEPKPAAARPIRGDLGSRVSRRADSVIEVVDVRAVPDFILQSPAVTEAIVSVVRAMAKAGTEIPGIRVTPGTKTSVS